MNVRLRPYCGFLLHWFPDVTSCHPTNSSDFLIPSNPLASLSVYATSFLWSVSFSVLTLGFPNQPVCEPAQVNCCQIRLGSSALLPACQLPRACCWERRPFQQRQVFLYPKASLLGIAMIFRSPVLQLALMFWTTKVQPFVSGIRGGGSLGYKCLLKCLTVILAPNTTVSFP